ncbi:carbon-nitrogen family hydrolase [Novipirellula caenicola]|uniref:Omega-amidase YafV n=1 Tax=Novipirellula caenicola TaxID=1536901 RepID=A0ABP9VVB0_9BACT
MKLRISLAQMDIALGEPRRNLETLKTFIDAAVVAGSDVLVLPELWSTGYVLEQAEKFVTRTTEGIFADVSQLAQQHRLHIVGSNLSLLAENQYGNTLTWAAPDGTLLGSYNKMHLFRLMDEEKYLTAGDEPVMIATPWGQVGLSICYDLRFPELYRQYALAGAQLILVPAEWPHPRLNHWRTLLRARAIENQLFVIACNRVGQGGDVSFCGHSAIVDPWGDVLVEGGEEEGLFTADIDTTAVEEIRAKIPVFADRRPELYTK